MSVVSLEKRLRIYERDGFRCLECGFQTTRERVLEMIEGARLNHGRFPRGELLTLDHVVPRAYGGRSVYTNLQTLCAPCNQRKGCRLPDGVDARPLALHAPRRRDTPRRPRSRRRALRDAARLHRPGCDPMFGCVGDCPVRGAGHLIV